MPLEPPCHFDSWAALASLPADAIPAGVTLLSVDVFDTLLLRQVAPELLVAATGRELERRLRARGIPVVGPAAAARYAVFTELGAKNAAAGRDFAATLREVLPEWLRRVAGGGALPPELAGELEDYELSLERRFSYPNKDLTGWLRARQAEGLRLVFCSDMYLAGEALEGLLAHHGLGDLFHRRLLLGGSRRAQKNRPPLSRAVPRARGRARRRCCTSAIARTPTASRRSRPGSIPSWCATVARHAGGARFPATPGASRQSRAGPCRWPASWPSGPISCSGRCARRSCTPWPNAAASSACARSTSFPARASSSARSSRSCGRWSGRTAADPLLRTWAYRGCRPCSPARASTVCASWRRRSPTIAFRPCGGCWRRSRCARSRCFRLARRHGLAEIDAPLPPSFRDWPPFQRLLEDGELLGHLTENQVRHHELLRGYLDQEGFFEGGSVALVDVGWSGQIQDNLCQACGDEPGFPRVCGLYLGVKKAARWNGRENSFLEGLLADENRPDWHGNAAFLFVQAIEALLRAPHGTVIGYQRRGDRIEPLLRPESERARQREAAEEAPGRGAGGPSALRRKLRRARRGRPARGRRMPCPGPAPASTAGCVSRCRMRRGFCFP